MRWYLLRYTHALIPARFDAVAYGPVILMRPGPSATRGLLAHEICHVREWWWWFAGTLWVGLVAHAFGLLSLALSAYVLSVGMRGIVYQLSRRYRQWSEVRGYRAQLFYGHGESLAGAVRALVEDYRLGLTPEQAEELLRS